MQEGVEMGKFDTYLIYMFLVYYALGMAGLASSGYPSGIFLSVTGTLVFVALVVRGRREKETDDG